MVCKKFPDVFNFPVKPWKYSLKWSYNCRKTQDRVRGHTHTAVPYQPVQAATLTALGIRYLLTWHETSCAWVQVILTFICIMQKKDSDEHVVLTKAGPSAETFSDDMFSKVCHPFSALYYIGSSVKTLICPIYIYIYYRVWPLPFGWSVSLLQLLAPS